MGFCSFISVASVLAFCLLSGVSCDHDHALGSLGSGLVFGFTRPNPLPFRRRMLVSSGSTPDKGTSTANPDREVLDLVAEDLDGSWVGTTSPVMILSGRGFPTCPETSSSCIKDLPLIMTITIADGKDFTYAVEKGESATCPAPVVAERLRGTVAGFENNQLSLSYAREQVKFDGTAPVTSTIQEYTESLTAKKQSACLKMEVYVEGQKVKADIKISLSYSGSLQGYLQYLQSSDYGFSVCKDEALSCQFDLNDRSSIVVETQQLVTLECTSGKCLELAEK